MADDKPRSRIDNTTASFMIVVALIFDLLNWIPFVNIVIAIIAWLIFGLWFYIKGVGFLNPRRLATAAGGFLIEVIPLLAWLPGLTTAIIITIIMVKSEDRLGINVTALASGKPPIKELWLGKNFF